MPTTVEVLGNPSLQWSSSFLPGRNLIVQFFLEIHFPLLRFLRFVSTHEASLVCYNNNHLLASQPLRLENLVQTNSQEDRIEELPYFIFSMSGAVLSVM
jgi:hypothetical protein